MKAKYLVRRLLLILPTFLGLTLIVFSLTHVGGNQRFLGEYLNPHSSVPAVVQEQQLSARFHLNDPLALQYVYWLEAFIQGDWGYTQTSIYSGRVIDAIALFFPNTLVLAVFSSILAVLIGIPLGVWSAVRKDSFVDQITRIVSFAGYSVPLYWLALLLIVAFASSSMCSCLDIFPKSGTIDIVLIGAASWYRGGTSYPTHVLLIDSLLHERLDIFKDAVMHMVLPVITLAYGIMAGILRVMRSGMLDTLNEDYVRTAWAKGLSESEVIKGHARRNALIPVLTVVGYLVAYLLSGVVLVEAVFNYVGIGYWTTQALLGGDLGGVMGATIIFGLAFIMANLIVDVLYAVVDPRIVY